MDFTDAINPFTAKWEPTLTINKWGFEDLGDDPTLHLWRATWDTDTKHTVYGINLAAYPVIKANPCSVWIDEMNFREATKQPWEDGAPGYTWAGYPRRPMKKRLIYIGSNQAWAKPSQEEAIRSLAVRLTRWAAHLKREVGKADSAIKTMHALRPEFRPHTRVARQILAAIAVAKD